jgi:hypothetical protein
MRTRTKNLISNLRAKGKVSIARAEAIKQMQEQELQVEMIRVPGRRPMKVYVVDNTKGEETIIPKGVIHLDIKASTGVGKLMQNEGRKLAVK